MRGKAKRQWMDLCGRAADEEDPKQLLELTAEISFLLQLRALGLGDTPENETETDDWSQVQLRTLSIQ
jgi:hypothetical protein